MSGGLDNQWSDSGISQRNPRDVVDICSKTFERVVEEMEDGKSVEKGQLRFLQSCLDTCRSQLGSELSGVSCVSDEDKDLLHEADEVARLLAELIDPVHQ